MATTTTFRDLDQIIAANEALGRYFFSAGAMQFFNSRVSKRIHVGPGGTFIVTSERDRNLPRRYTVRQVLPDGEIADAGEFQQWSTSAQAHDRADYYSVAGYREDDQS